MRLTGYGFKSLLTVMLTAFLLTGCDSSFFIGEDDLPAGNSDSIEVKEIIPEGAIPGDISIDLSEISAGKRLDLHGLTKEEAESKISSLYDFTLKVRNANPDIMGFKEALLSENEVHDENEGSFESAFSGEIDPEEYELPDIIGQSADILLNEVYGEHLKDPDIVKEYRLEIPYDEYADAFSSLLHDSWSVEGKADVLTSYDPENDEFLFGGAHNGYEIKQEKLKDDIYASLKEKKYDGEIVAEGEITTVSSDSIKNSYKELSSFMTHTTNIAVRNKNVSLAAQAINGSILQPGEEFSYNGTVGQRTKEKGYGEAGAYFNGEVVQEIGGGVCQVSTTLYNAVFRAGLESTERTSHTFSPSYVTPGCDATVSWGGPDYKFINSTDYPLGIRAHYADRKVYVSLYGVPVLEEGITLDLESHKTATLPMPAPVYIETGSQEKGTEGSIWEAYKVTYKDGEEIDRTFDHKSKYVGHTPRILVNPLIPPGMTEEEYNAALLLLQQQMAAQAAGGQPAQ